MKRSPRPGKTSLDLPQTTQQKLNMYALAAGGAGLLALAPAAAASIVYTPAHVAILGPRGLYGLDLNHDGIVDFKITNTTRFNTDQAFWAVFANGGPGKGNQVIGTFVYRGFPADARAMQSGSTIGTSQRFFPGAVKLASFYVGGGGYSAHGNWPHATDRYLGVKFQIAGETHYGWARFTVQTLGHPVRINAELTGYAYETAANTPIVAGQTSGGAEDGTAAATREPGREPAMLGLMAMGAPGIAMWRREESLDGERRSE